MQKLEKPEAIQWPAAGGGLWYRSPLCRQVCNKGWQGIFAAVDYKAGEAVSAEYPFAVAAQWPMAPCLYILLNHP